jgi:integrase
LAELTFDHLQQREDHWAVADLIGKAGHVRTVPVPNWVKEIIENWVTAAGFRAGRLFRCVSRAGTVWGEGMTEKVVWHVVKELAARLGVPKLAPHDRRRSNTAALGRDLSLYHAELAVASGKPTSGLPVNQDLAG